MNHKAALTAGALALALIGFGASNLALAGSKSIDLPPDGVQLKLSALPGYAKAQASCALHHHRDQHAGGGALQHQY